VLVNGFFAASEMALVSLDAKDIKKMKEQNPIKGKNVEEIIRDSTKYLSTIQVAITLAGFLSSAIAGTNLGKDVVALFANMNITIGINVAIILITLVLSYITLVLGELVPKKIALISPYKIATITAPIIKYMMIITHPFVWLLSISTNFVLKLLRIKPLPLEGKITEKDIKEMIVSGHIEGLYQTYEKRMLERVFQFDDLTAKIIMTPINEVYHIKLNDDENQMMKELIESGYSRVPVVNQENQFKGIILTKDLLNITIDATQKFQDFIREPLVINETSKINNVFHQMRKGNMHFAIVKNKKGQTTGIVTLEDIVEEVVGNIYDEYDETSAIESIDDLTYIVPGYTSIKSIHKQLGIRFKSKEDISISSYLLSNNEDMKENTSVTMDHVTYKILELQDSEIKSVKITIKEPKTKEK
jgi:putative hemolysin